MSPTQRQSLIDMMNSILACACCPPDIRFRAESLLAKLHGDFWTDIERILRRSRPL